eukprot:TRINITY_DN63940_c0_g1_i1.p1 TRINITY_DN63940_c0_g1~~TRINITY_DN63940_c0_g1_i1.p1  ORF type:complete len:414 (+),score=161.23 TRINITY_DN63940_c0_g1_i1:26-1243(+)
MKVERALSLSLVGQACTMATLVLIHMRLGHVTTVVDKGVVMLKLSVRCMNSLAPSFVLGCVAWLTARARMLPALVAVCAALLSLLVADLFFSFEMVYETLANDGDFHHNFCVLTSVNDSLCGLTTAVGAAHTVLLMVMFLVWLFVFVACLLGVQEEREAMQRVVRGVSDDEDAVDERRSRRSGSVTREEGDEFDIQPIHSVVYNNGEIVEDDAGFSDDDEVRIHNANGVVSRTLTERLRHGRCYRVVAALALFTLLGQFMKTVVRMDMVAKRDSSLLNRGLVEAEDARMDLVLALSMAVSVLVLVYDISISFIWPVSLVAAGGFASSFTYISRSLTDRQADASGNPPCSEPMHMCAEATARVAANGIMMVSQMLLCIASVMDTDSARRLRQRRDSQPSFSLLRSS